MLPRRRLLHPLASIAALGAIAGLPGVARALRIEDDNPAKESAYLSACEARSAHEKLIAELIADLEAAEGRDQAAAKVRAMNCPLCGCRLALSFPPEGAPPRF